VLHHVLQNHDLEASLRQLARKLLGTNGLDAICDTALGSEQLGGPEGVGLRVGERHPRPPLGASHGHEPRAAPVIEDLCSTQVGAEQTLEDADLGEVVGIRTPQVVSEVLGGRRPPRPVIIWVSQSGHGSGHGAARSTGAQGGKPSGLGELALAMVRRVPARRHNPLAVRPQPP